MCAGAAMVHSQRHWQRQAGSLAPKGVGPGSVPGGRGWPGLRTGP